MGVLADIFSHRIDHGNGSHSDVLIGHSGAEVSQYGFNPLQHPRGNPGNPGQFTKKLVPDMDIAGSEDGTVGSAGGGQDMPPPTDIPKPDAKFSTAQIEIRGPIHNKIAQLAERVPDYILDGKGRVLTPHITIRYGILDEDPRKVAEVVKDERPFRVVLGKVTIFEATEAQPYDVLKIDVHSHELTRLHNKIAAALPGVDTHPEFVPHVTLAYVQPGTGDKWIGVDVLEGEAVMVNDITFVNREHKEYKIPLNGGKDDYQLDQYAAKKRPPAATPLFDKPVQSQPKVERQAPTATPLFDRPVQQVPREERVAQPVTPKPKAPVTISVPRGGSVQRAVPEQKVVESRPKSLIDEGQLAESRKAVPNSQLIPDFIRINDDERTAGQAGEVQGGNRGTGRLDPGGANSDGDHGGTRKSSPVLTARSEHTTPADTSIVPKSLQQHLIFKDEDTIDPQTGKPVEYDYQLQRVAKAMNAMTQWGGFADVSGPGTGKSRTQIAVAKMWADQGYKAIIVTKKGAISADWDTHTYGGSFYEDGNIVDRDNPGALPKLVDGMYVNPEPGKTSITTYEKLPYLLRHIDDKTVLLYDESHSGKNELAARSKVMDEAGQKAKAVMYSTATPADKPIHIAHMFRARVFGNRSPDETFTELGLKPYQRKKKSGDVVTEWRVDPKVGGIEVYRRIGGLFDKMTQEGLMIKHEIDLTGTDAHFKTIKLPDHAYQELANLEDNLSGGLGINSLEGLDKGRALMHMRRQLEVYKIPEVVKQIQEEVQADPGRQIVVFADRVNESEVSDEDDNMVHYSQGTMKALADALQEAGIQSIGHLHGGSNMSAKSTIKQFQDGKTQVMLATIGTGGTGVDLPDLNGKRPRTVIMMTGPLAADMNVQAASRTIRLSSKSKSRLVWLFSDTNADDWTKGILAGKMSTLGAVVRGEVEKLQLPFDVGGEGVTDMIQSHRDRVALSMAHKPYVWKHPLATSGAPVPRRKISKQQDLFSQEGSPERYGLSFDELHPRDDKTKRFVHKHRSHTFAQNSKKPPTSTERKAYKEYCEFVKIGGTKAIPFKTWLQVNRAQRFHEDELEHQGASYEDRSDQAVGPGDQEGQGKGRGLGKGGREAEEKLSGGAADGLSSSDFDQESLYEGITVEMEHTDDPDLAEEIARDHLKESPTYYKDLKLMESKHGSVSNQTSSQKKKAGTKNPEPPSAQSKGRQGQADKYAMIRDFAASIYTNYYK